MEELAACGHLERDRTAAVVKVWEKAAGEVGGNLV